MPAPAAAAHQRVPAPLPRAVGHAWGRRLVHVGAQGVVQLGIVEEHGRKLERDTLALLQNARALFPNLRIAYLGSRTYGAGPALRLPLTGLTSASQAGVEKALGQAGLL